MTRKRSPLIVDALAELASRFVGDGNFVNVFFVSDEHGHVMFGFGE